MSLGMGSSGRCWPDCALQKCQQTFYGIRLEFLCDTLLTSKTVFIVPFSRKVKTRIQKNLKEEMVSKNRSGTKQSWNVAIRFPTLIRCLQFSFFFKQSRSYTFRDNSHNCVCERTQFLIFAAGILIFMRTAAVAKASAMEMNKKPRQVPTNSK